MAGQAVVTIKEKEWLVSLAITPWELEQGLGGLPELPPGTGMLFDLSFEQTIHVTTVPMLFPLDIAFLSDDLKVIEVYHDVEPGYLVTSTQAARYFIEVNAGELEDITPGDAVSVDLLPLEEIPVAPDWLSMIFGLAGFLMLGTFMVSIVRDFTRKAFEEPEAKPALLPQTVKKPARYDVSVETWQERDRIGVWIIDRRTEKVIAEWWDEDAREMFEQGFFKPGVPQRVAEKPSREFVDSVLDHAESVGLLTDGKYVAQTIRDACYWTAVNKDSGEIAESYTPYTSSGRALRGGKAFVSRHWQGSALVEVWRQPGRYSEGLKIEPMVSERFTLQKAPAAIVTEGKPPGTCYADAWRFLIKEGEGTLVHGTVFSGGRRMGHAWVETLTGWIWEPETGRYFTRLGFRCDFAPIEESRYTAEETAIMVARTKHLGPWTEQERQRYLKEKSPAVIPEQPRRPRPKDGLEFLPDSPEFLAYTIDDIGYRDKIDSAFLGAIARARGKRL